jgi:hypothetical protein
MKFGIVIPSKATILTLCKGNRLEFETVGIGVSLPLAQPRSEVITRSSSQSYWNLASSLVGYSHRRRNFSEFGFQYKPTIGPYDYTKKFRSKTNNYCYDNACC